MDLQLIERFIATPTDTLREQLFDDRETVFWVDWREEDDAIVEYCESVLQTGELSAELIDADTTGGYAIHILYREGRIPVPLQYSEADRHITIVTLNQVLSPDYEVRFCIDSNGADTLAFLPLATKHWRALEARYGPAVAARFYRLQMQPNVFTDRLPF